MPGVVGKIANIAVLPVDLTRNGVHEISGAAENVLGRVSRAVKKVGRRTNNTARGLLRGGKRNHKNKSRKNKSRKNKSHKNKSRKNKSRKNRK